MFNILRESIDGLEKIKLIHLQSGEYLSVIPAYGGNINELVLCKNNTCHELIAGDKNLDSLSGKKNNAYRGAKLSPFPNRIKDGVYVFNNQRYQLTKNDNIHALHGLLWNQPLSVIVEQINLHNAVLVLGTMYQNSHEGFPFYFRLEITYVLQPHQFYCCTQITNETSHAIPIGDGWHPYFMLDVRIDELKLQLPSVKRIDTNDSLIPTGRYIQDASYEQPTYIGDRVLDHCWELEAKEGTSETRLINEERELNLILWQKANEKGYRFIQVYTPPDRQSIAIEPTSCAPDAFNNKNGLIVLQPQEAVSFEFGVRLE